MKRRCFRNFAVLVVLVLLVVTTPVSTVSADTTTFPPLYQDGVYRLRNTNSGLYLGVYSSGNSNGINVIQKAYSATDKTIQFRLSFESPDGVSFWPVSMLGGYARVIDIKRGGKNPATGMNIQTYLRETPDEDKSQVWYIIQGSQNDRAIISPKYNTSLVIASHGMGAGGTGTSETSTGNVFVETYSSTVDPSQEWFFEYVGQATPTADKTIAQMENKFPDTKFWNHTGTTNNNDGYTLSACSHDHDDCGDEYDGSCGCNSYESSTQCLGFVKKINADVYGQSYIAANWPKRMYNGQGAVFLTGVKPGDVIEVLSGDGTHNLVVTAISDGKIYYVDCNSNGSNAADRCRIRWGRCYTPSQLITKNIQWIAQAPFAWY